jgi:hypothetical protein
LRRCRDGPLDNQCRCCKLDEYDEQAQPSG